MRFDGRLAPLHPTIFMACITLDNGKQYTTHFDDGNKAFESSIIITPQTPYSLRVNDLTHTRQDAFANADVDDESFSGQGHTNSKLVYAYGIVDGSWVRLGMAIKAGVTSLTLGDIDSSLNSNSNKNAQVPLIGSNSMLRGARYSCRTAATNNRSNYNNLMYWTITDNYGCESRFVLKADTGDNGNTLELLNG